MIRVFMIYKPKKLVVTKETDREVRKEYSGFELINTYKTMKGIKEKVKNLALRYKIEDIEYKFYVPGRVMIPITARPLEEQLAIGRKISESKKGFKMSEEWKAKIGAANRGRKITRTPAEKAMFASFRSKLGYKYHWVTNPSTGQNKQIRHGSLPPDGFVFGKTTKQF